MVNEFFPHLNELSVVFCMSNLWLH
jgi:hypothetical protein